MIGITGWTFLLSYLIEFYKDKKNINIMKINFYKNLLLVIVSILYFYFAFRNNLLILYFIN